MKKRVAYFMIVVLLVVVLAVGCAAHGASSDTGDFSGSLRDKLAGAASSIEKEELSAAVATLPVEQTVLAEDPAPAAEELSEVQENDSGEDRVEELSAESTAAPAVDEVPVDSETPVAQPISEPAGPSTPAPAVPLPSVPPAVETPQPVATQAPEAPAATPAPHEHSWTPVYVTVHHEAVTEEIKVYDQYPVPAVHDVKYKPIYICACGMVFDSTAEWQAHVMTFIDASDEEFTAHSSYSGSVDYNVIIEDNIVQEEIPEISHYETVVIEPAWDEEVIDHYVCEECGATKDP